jgi:hypothetical protein
MRPVRRYAALFVVVAIVAGGVYWARSDEADWWAYVDDAERGPQPKFKLHWPEQLVVSGVVGSFIAAPVVVAVFIARTVHRSG